ncbi:putative ribonuclease h protein, partial [Nicotiana attenuata]
MCFPVEEGGAGFRSLKDTCDAFSAKMWWKFRTKKSLIKDFLEAKYCKRFHPVARRKAQNQSHSWRRMMDIKEKVEPYISWNLGRGEISFWWDSWTEFGPLAQLAINTKTPKRTMVREFYHQNTWNQSKLRRILPVHVVNYIKDITFNINNEDRPIWTPDPSGDLSCKSAWHTLRAKKGTTFTGMTIWHKKLPFKISFFMMRVLMDKVATDVSIKRFGVNIASICNCYPNKYYEEFTNHLLSESHIANLVWSFFCNSCGIRLFQDQVRHRIMRWWLTKSKNEVQKTVLQCLPSIICWQIWKNRCSARFDEKRMSHHFIIQQVIKMTNMLIQTRFPELQLQHLWQDTYNRIEKLSPAIQCQIVYWQKPPVGWVKLNVDGCSKGNPGPAGGGGLIRDHHGVLIGAFAEFYGDCSCNIAEAKAMMRGIKMCISKGFTNVI